ncbi:MAG: cyclase [Pseudarthrobacter sp.]|nr:cyclase [Pseudarthrobacter sp.]
MSGKVQKRIVVDVPVSTAYQQWTQFEDFPHFMDGVESVTRLGDNRLKWVARIAGVRREWEATILEQVPDRRVAWASTGGATNSGAVEFTDAGGNRTEVALTLEYLPEGMLEKIGELLHVVGRQADHDLRKFKTFIEHQGHASGAWRQPASSTAESLTGDAPQEYNRFAHPFDQTGGLVDFEGESDGSAEGEYYSRGERRARRMSDGGDYPPPGGTLFDR